MWRKGGPRTLFVGIEQPLWETAWNFLKKTKTDHMTHNSTPGYICEKKKKKTLIQKDTNTPTFIAALFTVAKIWKQPKCPSIGEWIKKM